MFSSLNLLRLVITSFSSARFSTLIVLLEFLMLIFNIHFIGERNESRNDIIVSSKKGEMKCIIIIMFYTYFIMLFYYTFTAIGNSRSAATGYGIDPEL